MAYRGGATDPVEIIIQRQRAIRRVFLIAVLWWLLPNLWRLDLSWVLNARPAPSPVLAPAALKPIPKMSAGTLEQLLQRAPTSNHAPRNARCAPGYDGWDYVCTYQTGLRGPHSRLKIGVRVNATEVLHASAPQPLSRPLPKP